MKENKIIQLTKLTKNYDIPSGTLNVLKDVELVVGRGDIITVMGPSGCGKSTLLHVLGLLDSFNDGKYLLSGIDVSNLSEKEKTAIRLQKIGFIFQTFNLIQTLTVQQNVEFPMALMHINEKEQNSRSSQLLEQFDILDKKDMYPHQISIGEQQRVAIARALVNKPVILLADEPTGNLDKKNTDNFLNFLQNLLDTMDITLLIVSHNPSIKRIATRNYTIENGKLFEQ